MEEKGNSFIEKIESFLPSVEDIKLCDEKLRGPGWRFGFCSDLEGDPTANVKNIPFWKLQLDDDIFFSKYMFDLIQTRTEMKFELLEVYCNGQTFAQDGYPHQDDVHGETHTFLYYATQEWNVTHGGRTVFLIDGQKYEVDPVPNNAILFTTDLVHYGEAFNQFCRDLRMTVCFKLKEIK